MSTRATPQVSLIVATVDRVVEPAALLASLAAQAMADFEVIIVDQNPDDRLLPVLARFPALAIVHLRSPRGLSRSRNCGLAAARGAIIAFPDDDCRYDVDTLTRVATWLAAHPAADGVTGIARPEPGQRRPARFARHAHWLDAGTVWLGGLSCVIFLRAPLVRAVGSFDESLGLGAGTPWTASEETDYLARAVAVGARIRFEPTLQVAHPGPGAVLPAGYHERGARYGRAFGHVMRRNGCAPWRLYVLVARALGGAVVAAARGRGSLARFHCAVAAGRLRGWRDPVRRPAAPQRPGSAHDPLGGLP